MSITAKLNYLRMAPRKVRLVADAIRGKKVKEAKNILAFTTKRAAPALQKLLSSAVNNAKNQFQLDDANLYISRITVDEGPKLKRWMPRARGSVSAIQKKTSHITLVLDMLGGRPKKLKKIKKTEKKIAETKEVKAKKPKIKPGFEIYRPKVEKGIKRVFRRKAF
jgi:large subunit ribosomal protein L22